MRFYKRKEKEILDTGAQRRKSYEDGSKIRVILPLIKECLKPPKCRRAGEYISLKL